MQKTGNVYNFGIFSYTFFWAKGIRKHSCHQSVDTSGIIFVGYEWWRWHGFAILTNPRMRVHSKLLCARMYHFGAHVFVFHTLTAHRILVVLYSRYRRRPMCTWGPKKPPPILFIGHVTMAAVCVVASVGVTSFKCSTRRRLYRQSVQRDAVMLARARDPEKTIQPSQQKRRRVAVNRIALFSAVFSSVQSLLL